MSEITFLTQSDLTAQEFSRELEGEEYGVPASVILVDSPAGEGPSLHTHPYAELFFVVEGVATFTDGVNEQVVTAGGLVIVPPEHPHSFVNPGPERLRQIDVHLNGRFTTRWLTDVHSRAALASPSAERP
jgi:mannose-6-phosphate isomerase-like protein (cupin superfamily)